MSSSLVPTTMRDRRRSHNDSVFELQLRDEPLDGSPVDRKVNDTNDMVFLGGSLGSCSDRAWVKFRILFLAVANVCVSIFVGMMYTRPTVRKSIEGRGDFVKQACHYLTGNWICFWIYCVAYVLASWLVRRRNEDMSWRAWGRRFLDIAFSNFWAFGLATLLGIMVNKLAKRGPLDSMKQQ